ncbi:MAG: putative membrane protein [Kiritimatiellia bacterium]|jgi:uncharacterized membrane protein
MVVVGVVRLVAPMSVWLQQPMVLFFVLVALLIAVVDVTRPWSAGRATKVAATIVRLCMFSLLALALSRPVLQGIGGLPNVIFVVDCSDSIGGLQRDQAVERVRQLRADLSSTVRSGLVVTAGRAEVRGVPGSGWQTPETVECAHGDRTDLGAGVQLALALIDPAAGGRVVLITDGADTAGRLLEASADARELGVPVDVVVLDPQARDPSVRRLELDQQVVRPGQTVSGSVLVHAGAAQGAAEVTYRLDDEVISQHSIQLISSQDQRVVFEHNIDDRAEGGAHRITVDLSLTDDDPDLSNNRAMIELVVGDSPRVLAISNHSDELEAVARALGQERIEVVRRSGTRLGDIQLQEFDLVVIGDVPAAPEPDGMPPAFMQALRRWVSAGGGLITLGGDSTYDLGGWGDSALAPVLPLELHPEGRNVQPSVAMVKIMDNSASMGDWSGRHTKMSLANEGAAAAARLLRPRDKLAVLAVNEDVRWVRRLSPMLDTVQATAAIRSVRPRGGGIYAYTALDAALGALRGVDTPLKHVILYADAQDVEEKVKGHIHDWGTGPSCYQLASKMRKRGITLSVIALGEPRDRDVGFLKELARVGGGRFHITRDPQQLKALFVQETQQLITSVVHDDPFRATVDVQHPALAGIDMELAPSLHGYVEVDARDTATVVLRGPQRRTILATWRYGLGQVASFSTDLGPRWGRDWIRWGDYSRLVVQLARWSLRPPEARDTAVEVEPGELGSHLRVVRRTLDGLSMAEHGLRGLLSGEEGERAVTLTSEKPGVWTADVATQAGRSYSLILRDAGGDDVLTYTFIAPSSRELDVVDEAVVVALAYETGGQVGPRVVTALPAGPGQPRPLWWIPALLAVLLLPVDAWLRRAARVV